MEPSAPYQSTALEPGPTAGAQTPPLAEAPTGQLLVRGSRHAGFGAARTRRIDQRNFLLLAAAWALLLLLVRPEHDYPIIDDWLHWTSVRDLLNTGRFVLPDFAQANLFGLTVWGALWSKVLGFGFTTLTYSTLALALPGLFAFYGVMREVGVSQRGALFAAALLEFNPIFVHLSYSFMSDVPFMSLVLIACYCYLRGLRLSRESRQAGRRTRERGSALAWLLAGGFFAAWSYLIRQFGVLVPAAFVTYLLLEALVSVRFLSWRRRRGTHLDDTPHRLPQWVEMAMIALLPAVAYAGWSLARLGVPPNTGMAQAAGRSAEFVMKEPWLRVILLRTLTYAPVTALFAWGSLKLRLRRWLLAIPVAGFCAWGLYALDLPGEWWVSVSLPPFTAHIGPWSFDLPYHTFSFDGIGNIVRITGLDIFEYHQAPVWSPEVWRLIWLGGWVLAILLITKLLWALVDWTVSLGHRLRTRAPRAWDLEPSTATYLLGGMMFLVTVALVGDVYDRYIFGFLPFLLIFVARGAARWSRRAWAYSLAGLGAIALFTVAAQADYLDHDTARWQAGYWMKARVGVVHAGYVWDRWMGSSSDTYLVTDMPENNFRTEAIFPYTCRLCGFTTRAVLAQARNDMPPLPAPPQGRPAP